MMEKSEVLDHIELDSREGKEPIDKLISWVLRVTIALILLSSMFKIMHWPNLSYQFVIFFSIIIVFYAWRFSRKKKKTYLDYVKVIFVMLYSLGVILNDFRFLALNNTFFLVLHVISFATLLFILVAQGIAYFNNQNKKPAMRRLWNFSRFSIFFGIGFLLLGVLFKIMHWPFASILIIISTAFLILGILTHIREDRV